MSDDSWTVVLDGPLLERAERAIVEISGEIGRRFVTDEEPLPAHRWASVSEGMAGWAVLFQYLARAQKGAAASSAEALSGRALARAIDFLETTPLTASLYGGFTGVAWAARHLEVSGAGEEPEDFYDTIDEAVEEVLGAAAPWTAEYDLISGLVGLGVYALERLPHPRARANTERTLSRLEETAERGGGHAAWWTPAALLPPHEREVCPDGYFNLGVAHGIPGVIVFLARLLDAGVAVDRARPLLADAVSWLLTQRQPSTASSWFATATVRVPSPPSNTRVAWCYGDLGVSLALLQAAVSAGEPTWREQAVAMAREVATRRGPGSHVVDAALCHGASGVGHCFNRLFQATRDAVFKDAAAFWLRASLDMWPSGEGYGSLKVWDNPSSAWVVKPGLLEGAAGIAMALLAATTTVEPNWDRLLLTSVPPAPRF